MRVVVALVALVGGLLPIAAALLALRTARDARDGIQARLDQHAALRRQLDALRPAPTWPPVKQDAETIRANEAARRVIQEEIGALGLPRGEWATAGLEGVMAMRDIAAEQVRDFKREGALALFGVLLSTTAAIWSLYLPQ